MCKDLAVLILVTFSFLVTEILYTLWKSLERPLTFLLEESHNVSFHLVNLYLSVLLGLEFCCHGQNWKMLDALSSNNYYTKQPVFPISFIT